MSSSTIIDINSPPQVNLESLFWAQIIMTALYGIDVFIFCYSTHLLVASHHVSRRYIIFGAVMVALTTVTVFTNSVLCEFLWIKPTEGPMSYFLSTKWWQVLGMATSQIANITGDGFLLYRCYVIYNGRWKFIILPSLVYLGSAAMAVAFLVQSSVPGLFADLSPQFGLYWAILSVTLSLILTGLIAVRIIHARRCLQKYYPDRTISIETYTTLIPIVFESSLLFSILGLVFVATFGRNMVQGPAFMFVWLALSALSPQSIIFRLSSGRAWTFAVASDMAHSMDTRIPEFRATTITLSDDRTVNGDDETKARLSADSFSSVII
ncbi:hypothetical protein C8J56DRAFT_1043783 [Mycena floridula]|nr:hypothetical protein C8J56DRAFT_1043783 [Mycena floridula]